MNMNRRQWFKAAAGMGAGLALSELGVNVQQVHAATKGMKLSGTSEFTSACNFCSCGCGMICHVKDGKLINLEGDPDHIVNQGSLCSKGAAMSTVPNSAQRIKAPMYRAPGATEWKEISWDEAYDRIARKIKDTRDKYWKSSEVIDDKPMAANRVDAFAFMGGAQNTNEECYAFTKAMRLLGTVNVEHQARL